MTPRQLLDDLDRLGIAADTVSHAPVFTVEQSRPVKASVPGAHSKNLFLRDRKGGLFLVVARDETVIDLKRLHEVIGAAGRLSFGSADLLREVLGVEPGSVTPFAAVNDRDRRVSIVLDATLMANGRVNFHPLDNSMTTGVSPEGLLAFLRATGHEPAILTLPDPAPRNCSELQAVPS